MVLHLRVRGGSQSRAGVGPGGAAADVAIWALIFIYSSPQSTRGGLPGSGAAHCLRPDCILFADLWVSVAFKTALFQGKITAFETIQTMIAFLLAASSLLYFGPQRRRNRVGGLLPGLVRRRLCGSLCISSTAQLRSAQLPGVCHLERGAAFCPGCVLCLPPLWSAASLGAAAVAATLLGVRLSRLTLQFHGLAYLLAAAAVSGLLNYAFLALAGTLPGAPSMSVCLVSTGAILCYAAGKVCQGETWKQQLLHPRLRNCWRLLLPRRCWWKA
jgi:hypothetical protein